MRASIIIPSYNYSQFLGEAIESALQQTVPAHEILVIDDGSTDSSLEVARAYDVEVIERPHMGAPATMGYGVSISSGDCFVLLGADDRLAPNYLESSLPLLEAEARAGFVYTDARFFGTVCRLVPARSFSLARILAANYIPATALTRRTAYGETGGYEAIDLAKYEDWHLFLSMIQRGWYGIPTSDTWFDYRQHGMSRNATPGTEHEEAISAIMRDHPSLYRPSPALWYSLHRTVFRRFPRVYVGLLMMSLLAPRGKQ